VSIEEVSAEELAKLFHIYHQALVRGLDQLSAGERGASWDQTPQNDRKLMIAAARLALLDLAQAESEEPLTRSYFAKPGEADWGC
jgi:hypothetical protein